MFTVTEFIQYGIGALVIGFFIGVVWQVIINVVAMISNPPSG